MTDTRPFTTASLRACPLFCVFLSNPCLNWGHFCYFRSAGHSAGREPFWEMKHYFSTAIPLQQMAGLKRHENESLGKEVQHSSQTWYPNVSIYEACTAPRKQKRFYWSQSWHHKLSLSAPRSWNPTWIYFYYGSPGLHSKLLKNLFYSRSLQIKELPTALGIQKPFWEWKLYLWKLPVLESYTWCKNKAQNHFTRRRVNFLSQIRRVSFATKTYFLKCS